jgi:hypothetical protein
VNPRDFKYCNTIVVGDASGAVPVDAGSVTGAIPSGDITGCGGIGIRAITFLLADDPRSHAQYSLQQPHDVHQEAYSQKVQSASASLADVLDLQVAHRALYPVHRLQQCHAPYHVTDQQNSHYHVTVTY